MLGVLNTEIYSVSDVRKNETNLSAKIRRWVFEFQVRVFLSQLEFYEKQN